jgi:hypothetical protein
MLYYEETQEFKIPRVPQFIIHDSQFTASSQPSAFSYQQAAGHFFGG